MAAKPKTSLKRSRPKPKKRTHLPALSQLTRDMLALQMESDARIPPVVSKAIMQSFNAAANPGAESPEVVIATLDQNERDIVTQSLPAYEQILGAPGLRGKNALMMDLELDNLIEQEGDE